MLRIDMDSLFLSRFVCYFDLVILAEQGSNNRGLTFHLHVLFRVLGLSRHGFAGMEKVTQIFCGLAFDV